MAVTQIEQDAIRILYVLEQAPRGEYVDRNQVAEDADLTPGRVNDGMALLVNSGNAEWIQTFGTAWIATGREALARAYGDDESEYSLVDVRQ